MQHAPKRARGAGPAGDPDTEDDEIVAGVVDQDHPAARPKRRRAPPPEDGAEVPDGASTWMDRHGPSLYVVGCLAVLAVLMVLQSSC